MTGTSLSSCGLLCLNISSTRPSLPFLFFPLWYAEMHPQLCLLKDARSLDSDSLWRPHLPWKTPQMQWYFRYWGLELYQQFEKTQLSIGGKLAVPYTWGIAPIWALFPLVIYFLEPGSQGSTSMTIISHLLIMSFSSFSGLGGCNSRATEVGSVCFSAPVLWWAVGGHFSES